jgi:hypothetical protein
MPDITLTQLLDIAGDHARRILVEEQQDELLPTFDLRDAEGHGYLVMTQFVGKTRDEVIDCKDAIADQVRELIAKHKAVKYVFLSEAWMILRKVYREGISTPPADSADRIEVVIATATDGVDYQLRRWLIKRDGGKCVDLALDPALEGERQRPSGRFDNLLNAKGAST